MRFFLVTLLNLFVVTFRASGQSGSWASYPAGLNPSDEVFVKSYIDRYRNGLVNLQKDNATLLRFIEYVLTSQGIPKELKNLAVNESYLNKNVVSCTGAAGPWQFMPQTAIGYGLRVDSVLDERFNIYKSTYAAAKVLKQLYRHFQDWNLVLAAYSCGPGKVDKAIKRAGGARSFWDIEPYLPLETRNHIKKFISTSHVLDNNVVAPWQPKDRLAPDSAQLSKQGLAICQVNAGYQLSEIAKRLSLKEEDVKSWNPAFEKRMAELGYSWLALPAARMPEFLLYKKEILDASLAQQVQDDTHTN